MNEKPVGDRLLVKPDPVEEVTKGKIILSENAQEKSLIGTVISIGNEKEHKFYIRPGMRVRFGVYSGTEIQEEDEEVLLIMRQEDIYTIIS